MVRRRRRQEEEAARVGPAATPPSSEEDEGPEELSFGTARAEAEAARKLAGEAARRHRELLKERRRRRQELFTEQKRRKLLPEALLQELAAAPLARADEPSPTAAPGTLNVPFLQLTAENEGKHREGRSAKQSEDHSPKQVKKNKAGGTRSKGNYIAVHLKDENLTGLHQQTAKDFIYSQLYGPGTNRTSANEFFSIANKKDKVKKAAVQFVDKSWGLEKKQRATKFTKYWVARRVTSTL
ncbi:nucleolar protein 7 isoform X1 [Numida meleagris]|uniref:nucleolar protein 7 isoform X1 n=1 Tax=Numida meleagris TaxID=8996 RepID=UPI000B3E201B|nr:nucleolar protein 7 isoform X1 [Numida meleagris]